MAYLLKSVCPETRLCDGVMVGGCDRSLQSGYLHYMCDELSIFSNIVVGSSVSRV